MSDSSLAAHPLLRGLGRLAFDALAGVTDVVESMHATIASVPLPLGGAVRARADGLTGFAYGSVRAVSRTAREGLDRLLALVEPDAEAAAREPVVGGMLAALNGVVGDHLAEGGNPLAIRMQLRRSGRPVPLEREALAAAFPEATGKVLLLVHGICMSDQGWTRNGWDHGAALERDLGSTTIRLLYNSGRHVSENGRDLAALLEALVQVWPVEIRELTILAHSMGGLVARSACHYGSASEHAWLAKLRRIIFLGTPHHGAPLERAGNWLHFLIGVSPYSAPIARLAKLRSSGITDLRHGNLIDEDWAGRDRFARGGERRPMNPLPAHTECFAVAATFGRAPGDWKDRLLGDGLVPLASALAREAAPGRALTIPESHRWIAEETGHLDLLDRPQVYERVRDWLSG